MPRRIRLQVPRRSWAPSCLRPSRASPSGRRHGGQHDSRCARRRMIRPSPPVTTPSCITPAGKATEHGPSRRRSIDARLAGLRTLPAGFRACRRPTRGQRLIAETRARSSGYRAEWERSAQNHCRRSLSVRLRARVGSPWCFGCPLTGSLDAVARPPFPQNPACRFLAPGSSAVGSQHCECLQLPLREMHSSGAAICSSFVAMVG